MQTVHINKSKNELSVWKNRQFLTIWVGTSISNLTFHIFTLILPIIIYDLSASALAMSSMRAIELIPNIILGIFIGVLVDRYNRKLFMKITIFIQIICFLILYLIIYFGSLQVFHLYILGFLVYTCSYAFSNAYQSILPLVAPREQLINANSSITFLNTIVNIVGPGFAAFIIFNLGDMNSLFIVILGLSLLFIAINLLTIKNYEITNKKNRNFKHDILEGWEALTGNKTLWIATLMIVIFNLASSLSGAVLVYYALDNFRISEQKISFIFMGAGVGGLMGSVFAKKIAGLLSFKYVIYLTFLLAATSQLVMFVSLNWLWLVGGMLIMAFAVTCFNINYMTLRQKSTPNQLLGRVTGTSSMLMKIATPFGFLIAGIFAEVIPANTIFLISAIILMLSIILIIWKKSISDI